MVSTRRSLAIAALVAITAWWVARPVPVPSIDVVEMPQAAKVMDRLEQPAAPEPREAPERAATARRPDEGRSITVSTSALVAEIERLDLRHRAGDPEAGYPLFTLLEQCARAPAIAEQLRRDRRELPSGPAALPDSVINEASFLEGECARLPAGLLARRLEFLEAAAAQGDVRARVDYASYPPEYFSTTEGLIRHADKVVDFKAKAATWLHAAADRGSALALLKLAGIYREGVLVERDNVTALAYYLAWDEAGGSDGGVDPYRQQREWGMSTAQLQQAREMQQRIVERCCR
jgi:hypothetical protein